MTDKQRLELRNSEIRSRLATLGAEDATEDAKVEIGKLSEEYGSNETRIRAFMVANDVPVLTTTTITPTFPIWLNIPLSKSSAFFKPLSICETLAVGMAIITP